MSRAAQGAPLGAGAAGTGYVPGIETRGRRRGSLPAASPGTASPPPPRRPLLGADIGHNSVSKLSFPSRPSLRLRRSRILRPAASRRSAAGPGPALRDPRPSGSEIEADCGLSPFCFPFHQPLFALIFLHRNSLAGALHRLSLKRDLPRLPPLPGRGFFPGGSAPTEAAQMHGRTLVPSCPFRRSPRLAFPGRAGLGNASSPGALL